MRDRRTESEREREREREREKGGWGREFIGSYENVSLGKTLYTLRLLYLGGGILAAAYKLTVLICHLK